MTCQWTAQIMCIASGAPHARAQRATPSPLPSRTRSAIFVTSNTSSERPFPSRRSQHFRLREPPINRMSTTTDREDFPARRGEALLGEAAPDTGVARAGLHPRAARAAHFAGGKVGILAPCQI